MVLETLFDSLLVNMIMTKLWPDTQKCFFSQFKAKTAFKRSTLKHPYHSVMSQSSQAQSVKSRYHISIGAWTTTIFLIAVYHGFYSAAELLTNIITSNLGANDFRKV